MFRVCLYFFFNSTIPRAQSFTLSYLFRLHIYQCVQQNSVLLSSAERRGFLS